MALSGAKAAFGGGLDFDVDTGLEDWGNKSDDGEETIARESEETSLLQGLMPV